jgi:hypothetical protein
MASASGNERSNRELEAYKVSAATEIAALEKETERLRSANLALEEKIQPRRISGQTATRMSEILSRLSGMPIAIVSRIFDPKASDFADDLDPVFKKAGWTVTRVKNWTKSDKGVFLATLKGTDIPAEIEVVISAALDAAGIKRDTIEISGDDTTTIAPSFQERVLYLLVGAKP